MEPFPLAAELVELILFHVSETNDLLSVRLLSQAFCQAASRMLYRTIGITLHYGSTYSEKRCKILNDMIESKPYILSYIRSLRVNLLMEVGPWTGELTLSPADDVRDVRDPDCVDHQQFTKLLLTMTRAARLEELSVKRNKSCCLTLRHIGRDIMMGLLAVRLMPSLRRLQLINLIHPPTALVIGHPGVDRVTTLTVKGGVFDIEESEANWKGLGIPAQGPLSTSFKEAKVDWDSVLRVHFNIDTFDIKETPLFHSVTHVHLDPILPFYEHMLGEVQRRMGGRQPAFWKLKVLHYRSFAPPVRSPRSDQPDPLILENTLKRVAGECSTVQKLIVDIVIDLLDHESREWDRVQFPTTGLSRLREIQFSLVKDHPQNRDTTKWIPEVARWLRALSAQHRIEQITISWFLTLSWGDIAPHRLVHESPGWRELEELLDTIPVLSNARMVFDAAVSVDVCGGDEDWVMSEECAQGLRTVWKHPRCSASVQVPSDRAQFYDCYK